MRLEEMLAEVEVTRSTMAPGASPVGVTCDSRRVRPGDLFVAVKGLATDGLKYLEEVIGKGAAGVVVGPGRLDEAAQRLSMLVTRAPGGPAGPGIVEVADERRALALLARNAAGRPDLRMQVAGITGTNGKTTTAWLLAAVMEAAGLPCGIMGTVEYRFGGRKEAAPRTTPEAPEIHRWLRSMVDGGAKGCAMEVSSHALDLQRVAGIRFAAAVFTNLTQDHLDYHPDMESYYLAKRRLFEALEPGAPAVINIDDPWGRRLAGETKGRAVTYGTDPEADLRIAECRTDLTGTRIVLEERSGAATLVIESPLVGHHNALNLAAAAATARALGVAPDAVTAGLAAVKVIPGRLERVEAGQPFAVLVDYAHTDDALKNVLEALRPLTEGRLITVFGCGGDRDRTKRPRMGFQAASLSDLCWVTSDNPRTEDPNAIIEMILEGVRQAGAEGRSRVQPDRARAIAEAVAEAREGDTVLIAGKGHERVQIGGGRSVPFDDVEVARKALHGLRGPGRGGQDGAAG